jgi:hypothetical protein
MQATHSVHIPLALPLSKQAQQGHVLDGLKTGSLISIGKLCDDDCIAIFSKFNVKIIKDSQLIITGTRDDRNGLWNIPLAPLPPVSPRPATTYELACSAISDNATKAELAAFLHGSIFSPLPSTLLRALQKRHFTHWPGFTEALIRKHLPKSLATSKGHLRSQQKNIRSTKLDPEPMPPDTAEDVAPSQEPNNTKTNEAFTMVLDSTTFAKSYSDQTGRFPVQSSRGNNYVFILYDYDSNAILSKPLPNRRAGSLDQKRLAPMLHHLENQRLRPHSTHPRQRMLQRSQTGFPQARRHFPTRATPQPPPQRR